MISSNIVEQRTQSQGRFSEPARLAGIAFRVGSFLEALLGIDGVLNSGATPNPRNLPYIVDAQLVSRFRDTVDATRATVVLSSTWRVDSVGLLAVLRSAVR
jgi:HAD domain in Swiss Army Knife RNA repair proteins